MKKGRQKTPEERASTALEGDHNPNWPSSTEKSKLLFNALKREGECECGSSSRITAY